MIEIIEKQNKDIIEKEGDPNLEISRFLNLPINSVTPRVLEIRDKGLIIYHHTAACPITGRSSRFYIIKDWIKGVLV